MAAQFYCVLPFVVYILLVIFDCLVIQVRVLSYIGEVLRRKEIHHSLVLNVEKIEILKVNIGFIINRDHFNIKMVKHMKISIPGFK